MATVLRGRRRAAAVLVALFVGLGAVGATAGMALGAVGTVSAGHDAIGHHHGFDDRDADGLGPRPLR